MVEQGARVVETEPSLVCWQTGQGPLTLLHIPQQLWLLLCSLVFLILGLGLFFAPFPRALFWFCIACFAGAIATVGVLWPAALPVVAYGCEPGALVLVLAMGVHALRRARYRRQVVFMPGFKRVKSGSSLIQGNNQRKREPSTIDQEARAAKPASSEARSS